MKRILAVVFALAVFGLGDIARAEEESPSDGMPQVAQAEALAEHDDSRAATQGDIRALKGDIDTLKGDIDALEVELKGDIRASEMELKGGIRALEVELKGDIRASEMELKSDIRASERELKGDIVLLKEDIRHMEARIDERISRLEDRMIQMFLGIIFVMVALFGLPQFPGWWHRLRASGKTAAAAGIFVLVLPAALFVFALLGSCEAEAEDAESQLPSSYYIPMDDWREWTESQLSAETIQTICEKARRDDVNALIALGELHYLGMGVPQNFTKAARWLHQAALRGSPAQGEINHRMAETQRLLQERKKQYPFFVGGFSGLPQAGK